MFFTHRRFLIARFALIFVLLVGVLGAVAAQAQSIVYRVAPDGAVSGLCGADWSNPCDLQYALTTLASVGNEIWVAAGTYKPTQGTNRALSFVLKNGVAIYGGFSGVETLRSERDLIANPTTLSGDIGLSGDNADNSYHVVVGSGTDTSAILDGFTITGGHANGPLLEQWSGGGMYIDHGNPTLVNLTFHSNWADASGGGLFNYYSNPSLMYVLFTGNSATDFGGGLNNSYSSPTLTNVTFSENVGTDFGGGMSNFNSSAILIDVIFNGNAANYWGGGMHNGTSTPSLTNVTFSANSASHGGGMYNHSGGNPILNNVIFNSNSATFGGAMKNSTNSHPHMTNVTFSYNTAQSGGAMHNYQSNATMTQVIFSRNTSGSSGGAMYNQQSDGLSLTDVTFTENSANRGSGGAIFNYANSPSLTNVTFQSNVALDGGGMYNHTGSSPVLTNVTFSNNVSSYSGGGMVNTGNSNPTLTNVTFSGNSTRGTGIGMHNSSSNPTLINVLLWNDTFPDGGEIYNSNASPLISYSIVRGSGGSAAWNAAFGTDNGNNLDANPLLEALADNGGYTQTMAVGAGSPAIDTGDGASCPLDDQRGLARPQGAGCDMGAFEAVEYTISGKINLAGVTIYYSGGTTTTDGDGNYSLTVPYAWSGSITPYMEGYRFIPESRNYSNVQSNQPDQDFTAERVFSISGNAGVAGATLSYQDQGVLKTVTTLSNGEYSIQVPEHWTGTVTPSKANVAFTPASRSYADVQADRAGENYSAVIKVVNQNDAGAGSLRQAVNDAVSGATIHFDPALAGQTITLSSQITINKNLILDGSGSTSRVEISGKHLSRIFYIDQDLTVTLRSLVLKNGKTVGTTYTSYGGAVSVRSDTQLTIEKVSFVGNSAPQAGALYASGFAKVMISESEFLSNSAELLGGAIYLPTPLNLKAVKTKFANNSASSGGAIYLDASGGAVFEENVFENNTASSGGGAIASQNIPGVGLTIKRNLFSDNLAGTGGGAISISRFSSTFVIMENNTFYGNQAGNVGGAVASGTSTDLLNNTFSNNQAVNGGASVSLVATAALNKLYNNLFANSTGGAECLPATSSAAITGNHNLVEDGAGSCAALPGTIIADPLLGPLGDNGGPTHTMSLSAESPAINAGDLGTCLSTDQRGIARPQGSGCEIGAFEYIPLPTATPTNTPTLTPTASNTPISSCNAVYHGPLTFNGGMSMSITNQTGVPLLVQDVFVTWNHDTGHSTGADKTLRLQQASLNGVGFFGGDLSGPSLTITPSTLFLPTGTSAISFNFHQSYDFSDGSERIFITLATNGCQSYPIDSGSAPVTHTPTPTLTATPPYSYSPLLLSLTSSQTVGGVASADEDILRFDGQNWSLAFDGSDVGVGSPDLFAFSFLDADSILMAFTANVTVNGITAAPQDVLRFDATSLGSTTAGTWSLYFDGSDVGLDSSSEAIDSLTLLPDGRLLISTTGNPSITGMSGAADEDVLAFMPTTLGSNTSGSWSVYFDGSDVGLADTNNEDVDALDVTPNGRIYLSTLGDFVVNGVSGADEDVFVCVPASTGSTTACNYLPALYFDGSTWGLSGNDVDAFNFLVVTPPSTPPSVTPSTPTPTATASPSPTPTFTRTATSTPSMTSTPPASMFLRVLQPNGGETLHVGAVYRITWDSTSDIDTVTIGYKSCDSCLSWIANNIANTGYYDWTVSVGNTINTQFKIYIIGYDTGVGSISDVSDSNFTVLQPTATPTQTRTPTATATASQTSTPTATAVSSTFTFLTTADAYVNAESPITNYGSSTTLRVDASPDVRSYLRFNVQGLNGTITRATVRVFANSASSQGSSAHGVTNNTWTESTINYSNAPATGGTLGSSGSFGAGVWISMDVTAYITGNGTYNLALTTPGTTAVSLASREAGARAPQLIIETSP